MGALDGWIAHWADHQPNAPAIQFEGLTTTYGVLHQRVAAAAAGLVDHGVSAGDRVAFCGLNRIELLDVLFACARLGAAAVPLNNRLAAAEHRDQLAHADCALVLATDGFADAMGAAAPAVTVRDLDAEPFAPADDVPPTAGGPDSPALMVFTSGTTGTPKAAVLSQSALHYTVLNGIAHQQLSRADRVLTMLPLFHVGGLNIQTLPALYVGGAVVLQRSFDPIETLGLIAVRRPTQSLMVPAVLQAVAAQPDFAATDLTVLRGINTGSSVVPEAAVRPFLDRGVPVGQVYGATETGPTAVVLDYDEGERHLGSCGKAALHTELRIVADGADVEPGQDGELWLRGPNLFTEYWRNSEATEDAFVEDWYRTGDVGHRDHEGYVFITDRMRDIIISGGENIAAAQVETVLLDHPDLAEVAVIGRPDERWGEMAVAVVVPSTGASPRLDDIRAWCEGRLAHYKQPRDLVVVDELPRTALGKVQKHLLRGEVNPSAP